MRLIDADAIIYERHEKIGLGIDYNVNEDSYYDVAYKTQIDKIPTTEKTGRWIIEPGIGCKCSQCEFDIGNDLDWMEYVNYCPSCGARMVGE